MTATSNLTHEQRSLQRVRRLASSEASLGSRIFYTALLVFSLSAGILLLTLWLTEPEPLPTRTKIGFLFCLAAAFSWAAFAGWTLSNRRRMFARQKVVASALALVFTSLFLVGGVTISLMRGRGDQAALLGVTGGTMVACAALLHAQARTIRRLLLEQKERLDGPAEGSSSGNAQR